ncbi:MAG: MarR family transcriptional regulator [Erysipelotrichaceae bacterium]|nr:MarR family transcriptional regulator [Erysipelotrichaceae bacterium]
MEKIELIHKMYKVQAAFKSVSHRNFTELNRTTDSHLVRGNGRLLATLVRNPEGISQKQLAEKLEIRPQSLTDALEVLERDGMIVRERDDKDRRVITVKITEKGRETEKVIRSVRHKTADEVFAPLDEKKTQVLADLLDEIYRYNEEREDKGEL